MTRPSLLVLSFSPIASDARVLKQVRRFTADYEVTTCGYGPAPDGVVAHVEIPAELPSWRYPRGWLLARQYRRAYWGNAAVAFARAHLPHGMFDVVLANDVESVGLALDLAPRHGVHADLHEYAPRQKENVPRWRWFVAPFVRWMCRRFVARAQSWTTVGAGLADEYAREFGFRPAVVTNATPYVELPVRAVGNPLRLVHSGAALPERHLEIMIEAAVAARTGVVLDLYLTLNDPGYVARLRALAGEGTRVRVLDPVPYDRLVSTLHEYDVGLMVLPPVSFSYRWALPNKVFDYVQARLGLVVGPSPEMARVVRGAGVGAVTEDFTAAALTATLDGLDAATVASWKLAASQHARELSSESQVTIWAAAIERLLSEQNL